jgi:predicted lactoylglutathione lyase
MSLYGPEVKGKRMSKKIFVNLPVRDLKASTTFYTALGGALNPQFRANSRHA